MINKGLFSSNSNEWATPTDFYNELDAEFHFNLDPCSTHENAKCERHYTIDNDGLSQKWGERAGTRVFCNPPYGREIGKWVKKCYEESKNCEVVVMLIPPERTRLISTTTSITRPRKSASSVAGFISTIQNREHRSRQW